MLPSNSINSEGDSEEGDSGTYDFVEGEFTKSLIHGISAIVFSDRVQNHQLKDMGTKSLINGVLCQYV